MVDTSPRLLLPSRTTSELAGPELAAAVLDGDLLRLGDAFHPVDLPIGPAERVAALRTDLGTNAVVARRAAAWVWGACWQLELPIATFIPVDAFAPSRKPSSVTVHQVMLTTEDVTEVDGVRVTTPRRTAVDLARAPVPEFDQQALGRLLRIAGITAAEVIADLETRPRIPHRIMAIQRLQVLFTR